MKKVVILVLCLGISTVAFGAGKSKCKKKYTEVSCAEVEGAKRKSFCWKGKVSDEKKSKICMKEKKKRKYKKTSKKGS